MTFLITTQVTYEREGKTHLLQHVHVVRADGPTAKDQASAHIEQWLDETWATPAYFGHEYEIRELPGVTLEGENAALEYAVSESPITIYPSEEQD